jgi:hypothetical protein
MDSAAVILVYFARAFLEYRAPESICCCHLSHNLHASSFSSTKKTPYGIWRREDEEESEMQEERILTAYDMILGYTVSYTLSIA